MVPSLAFSRNVIKKRREAAETPLRFQSMRKIHSSGPSVITHQIAVVLSIGFKHLENSLKTQCKG